MYDGTNKVFCILSFLQVLFFFGVFLFCVDMVVMAVAILRCQCCGAEPPYPHRHPRTYPLPAHYDDDDFDYYYHPPPLSSSPPRRLPPPPSPVPTVPARRPEVPEGIPAHDGPVYPTSLPQMSTWRDYQR